MDHYADAQEPLLPTEPQLLGPAAKQRHAAPAPPAGAPHAQPPGAASAHGRRTNSTFWPCTFNLTKAITGAGMMAIPAAYLRIGSLLGTLMLVAVAALSYYTLAVLILGSAASGASTYSELVRATCGRAAMKVLQLSVLSFCFGFSVVYMVVLRDILVGTPGACDGLLCEVLGLGPSSPWSDGRLVLVLVALLVCSPLLLVRSMERLAPLNVVGVAAVLALALASLVVGAAALAQGAAHRIPLFPQWESLGPTRFDRVQALTEVVPVILACYVVHQNLHPVLPLLRPYSPRAMLGVAAVALSLACCVFLALSVGCGLAFGPGLEANVLENFSAARLEPLLGFVPARLLGWGVRLAYLVSVLGSVVLYSFPLRAALVEMLFGGTAHGVAAAPGAPGRAKPGGDGDADAELGAPSGAAAAEAPPPPAEARWQRIEREHYFQLTFGLLFAMVVVAVLVPSIWSALSIIGDLSSTVQAFVVPGAVALVLAARSRWRAAGGDMLCQPCSSAAAAAAASASGGGSFSGGGRGSRRRCAGGLDAVHLVLGTFVVLLGTVLFANGVYSRV